MDRRKRMDLYTKLLIFYGVMATICALVTWFLTKERRSMRLLSALLVGATWPISFPVALLISLF